MEESNEVRVKDETIFDSQSMPETREVKRQSNRVKKEPIDIKMETSKSISHIEVKTEEKFSSSREEVFSIGFLNKETSLENNKATTSNKRSNKHNSNVSIDKQRYKCDFCEKRFNQSCYLVAHRRIHTGERPFECDICQKSFSQLSTLLSHRRTHNGERPFECDVCKKRFYKSIHLVNHRRTHTGEKPYECDVCKKRFHSSNALVYHRKTHTGEKPYECEICKMRFIQSSQLVKHRRNHTLNKTT